MKPKIKAARGWKYRIIIADSEGNYNFDDVNSRGVVGIAADRITCAMEKDLLQKREKRFSEKAGTKDKLEWADGPGRGE